MMDHIYEICNWNEERGLTKYLPSLEYKMLDEEVEEYMEACITAEVVDQADAIADIIFVAVGSLYKLCEGDLSKVDDILLAVTAANNTKGGTTVGGKITKPVDFTGPEDMIIMLEITGLE